MSHIILSGSYKNHIYSLKFNPPSNLELISTTSTGHRPSWITFHPVDRSLVFTALEQPDGKIIVVRYGNEGEGEVVSLVSSGGEDPCSLLATTDELVIANYTSGSIAIYTLSSSSPFLTHHPKVIQLKGSGPNPDRQESSHAHQVILHPSREELLVPDLGADKVWRLSKSNANGDWEIVGDVSYSQGSGPRHVAFYDGMLYTLTELTNSITTHTFPPLPSPPTHTHTTSTLSEPFESMLAAEILIPTPNPTFPHPYLYVSNRNDPRPAGDTIAIFSLADKAKPLLVNEVPTGLRHLRGIEFGGPGDKWLVAGGVKGGGVKVFERTEGGKNLEIVAENQTIEAPTGFLWL